MNLQVWLSEALIVNSFKCTVIGHFRGK